MKSRKAGGGEVVGRYEGGREVEKWEIEQRGGNIGSGEVGEVIMRISQGVKQEGAERSSSEVGSKCG